MFRAGGFLVILMCLTGLLSLPAKASDHPPALDPSSLPFEGETPLLYMSIYGKSPSEQAIAIVKSCAPRFKGCADPILKVRSLSALTQSRLTRDKSLQWAFADLDRCEGAMTHYQTLATDALGLKDRPEGLVEFDVNSLSGTARFGGRETRFKPFSSDLPHPTQKWITDFQALLNTCLTQSYMTPPWER